MNGALFFLSRDEDEGGGGGYIDVPAWLALPSSHSRASQSASIIAAGHPPPPQPHGAHSSWRPSAWVRPSEIFRKIAAEVADKRGLIGFFGVWWVDRAQARRPYLESVGCLGESVSPQKWEGGGGCTLSCQLHGVRTRDLDKSSETRQKSYLLSSSCRCCTVGWVCRATGRQRAFSMRTRPPAPTRCKKNSLWGGEWGCQRCTGLCPLTLCTLGAINQNKLKSASLWTHGAHGNRTPTGRGCTRYLWFQ